MGGGPVSKTAKSKGEEPKWNKRLLDDAPAPRRLSWSSMEFLTSAKLIVTQDKQIYIVLIKEGYPSDGPKKTSPQFRTTLFGVQIHKLEESDNIAAKLAELSSVELGAQSQQQIMESFGEINRFQKKMEVDLDLDQMQDGTRLTAVLLNARCYR
jgi:hypothetical protein